MRKVSNLLKDLFMPDYNRYYKPRKGLTLFRVDLNTGEITPLERGVTHQKEDGYYYDYSLNIYKFKSKITKKFKL